MTVPPPEEWSIAEVGEIYYFRISDDGQEPGVYLEAVTDTLHVRDCPFCDEIFEAGLRTSVERRAELHVKLAHEDQAQLSELPWNTSSTE